MPWPREMSLLGPFVYQINYYTDYFILKDCSLFGGSNLDYSMNAEVDLVIRENCYGLFGFNYRMYIFV